MTSLIAEKTAAFYKLPCCLECLWQKGPYGAKIETEKSAKSFSTKNTKHLCKSTCYDVTNLELTSSRILSLLNPNSYTSSSDIVGSVTPRMLSKKEFHTQFTSRLHSQSLGAR